MRYIAFTTTGGMKDIVEIIVVMRHGIRADRAGEGWSESQTRPWDPPLSSGGWEEAVRSGKASCNFLKVKPDLIFTSPFTRCLQTASAVAKACRVPLRSMVVDRGLSETYDYLHIVRTVSSDDMMVDGEYANMGKWFYSERRRPEDSSDWRLRPGLNLEQRVDRFVYDVWKEPERGRHDLHVQGKFPDFEMYANLGFNRGGQVRRYVRALDRCIKELQKKSKGPRVGVIVTHGAGVKALYEHLLQTSPKPVDTAGYFVVYRENRGAYRLLVDRLATAE